MKKRMFFTLLGLLIVFGGVFGYKAFVAYKTEQYFANQPVPAQTVSATEAVTATWQPRISATGHHRFYYYLTADHQIWLFTLYDRDEAADLNADEKKALKKAIQTELEARRQKS